MSSYNKPYLTFDQQLDDREAVSTFDKTFSEQEVISTFDFTEDW